MHQAGRAAEGDLVLVEVHRHRVEDQSGHPGLLGRLAQRRLGQGAVRRLAVAAELEPAAGLRVQGQQHLAVVGGDARARRRSGGRAGSRGPRASACAARCAT